jgi:hypothetical protein
MMGTVRSSVRGDTRAKLLRGYSRLAWLRSTQRNDWRRILECFNTLDGPDEMLIGRPVCSIVL